MNLRLAILTLAAKYELSADAGAELKQLAHLGAEPPSLSKQLPLGMAVLGAVLGGLGIIFWIAANWESLSRFGRFALLQATMVCMLIGAWRRRGARVPLSLVGFLACGALFAYFGQTYQTGADPWQLFALWAALTLPLCLGVRHEALWTAWAVVALTAALLWAQTPEGPGWQRSPFRISLGWWVPAIVLALAFRLTPVRLTGAGLWPMRLCMIYATLGLAATAVWSLFSSDKQGIYPITLVTLAILAYAFSRRNLFDVFVVSALGLGANVLLLSGLARLLLRGSHDTLTGAVLVIGCVAAALLAGTVKLIMHLTREHAGEQTLERAA
jgi:uncharacterized membrane protein